MMRSGADMKILFTSDLHGDLEAFKAFTRILNLDFDIGVISGDLLEDAVTLNIMKETLSVDEDDLLEELYDPDDSIEDLTERVIKYNSSPKSLLSKTRAALEKDYRDILTESEKKIILIPGNHDRSNWESGDNIVNINLKRFDFGQFNFVGFRYTRLDITEDEECKLIKEIEDLIDENTILVTHAPAFGIRDKNVHGISIGSQCILDLVKRKSFKLHLFGHVHESFGRYGRHINGAFQKQKRFISIGIREQVE